MSSARKTRLTDRQQELLRGFTVTNNRAVFGGPQILDWAAVKKVMLALGGEWVKGKKTTGGLGGFVFPDDVDAAELIRVAYLTGEIIDPNQHDFFPTPDELADRVATLATVANGQRVLEPSAGQGALVGAVRRIARATSVTCFELLPANVRILQLFGTGVEVRDTDFLRADPADLEPFDRVVMNPPFGKRADLHHVRHAFSFLKPGGRLVAIMSAGVKYRDDSLGASFRADLLFGPRAQIIDNPAGSFKSAGTMVNTVTVVIDKRA